MWNSLSFRKHLNIGCRTDVQTMSILGPLDRRSILDFYTTSELDPQFGRPTMTKHERQYDDRHLKFGLGLFFIHHMNVYDRCREFRWLINLICFNHKYQHCCYQHYTYEQGLFINKLIIICNQVKTMIY